MQRWLPAAELGAPLHRCQLVKEVVAAGVTTGRQLECLLSSAPERHVTERVGNLLQRFGLKHRCNHDGDGLRWDPDLAIRRRPRGSVQ